MSSNSIRVIEIVGASPPLTQDHVKGIIHKNATAPIKHILTPTKQAAEAAYRYYAIQNSPSARVEYERDHDYHRSDMASFARLVDIQPGESVLDLGTGPGWVLEALQWSLPDSAPPSRFVGVDASQSMIALARSRAQSSSNRARHGHFRFIHDSFLTLGEVVGTFDIITCCWAFQHILVDSRQSTLKRWKELLAPGGRILFDFAGDHPHLCAVDLEHPLAVTPTRAFVLENDELRAFRQAYKDLTSAAGLALDPTTGIKILGINNHSRALGNRRDYSGTGYEDFTDRLRPLYATFASFAGRDPSVAEKQSLKLHYMSWVHAMMVETQPIGSTATVEMRVKVLGVVGVLRRSGQ